MSLYYQDDGIALHLGDSLEVARGLPSGSVDCVVTSPPYYGLRDYGNDGQYGLEKSPAAYVETLCSLFNELRRVLSGEGTLWLNIGDSYSSGKGGKQGVSGQRADRTYTAARLGAKTELAPKNLLGIPWRVAFALQDDGWTLRNDIIWSKPNPMPESVKDRLARSHEHVFLFSKQQKYYFDAEAIAEPLAESSVGRLSQNVAAQTGSSRANGGAKTNGNIRAAGSLTKGTRNRRDVWEISTQPFSEAHFATMPPELARLCITAGCIPGGTVLDPFSGSGTTGMVAQDLGRRYIGIDISKEYLKLSLETRLRNAVLDFSGAA